MAKFNLGRMLGILVFAIGPVVPALAQTPFVPNEEHIGRTPDNYTLSFCVDPRDPAHAIDQQIGEAIASALLIQPKITIIKDPSIQNDLDQMYQHLLQDCDLYFGFKLQANNYPDWLTITRPYYNVGYVTVVSDPSYKKLGDIPHDKPIGPTVGTSADFRFIQYDNALPDAQRWPRYPVGTDAEGLQQLKDGTVAAAIIWAPSLAAAAKTDPAVAAMHVIP